MTGSPGAVPAAIEQIDAVAPEIAEELRQLPPEQQAEVFQAISLRRSGPLPAPEDLQAYETALPGLAERIVSSFEREQAHRHRMEGERSRGDYRLKARGQLMGLVALFAMLAIVAFMVREGAATEAAALGTAVMIGVVAVYVTGRVIAAREDAPDEG
jgi:uncharacterized membrane protein